MMVGRMIQKTAELLLTNVRSFFASAELCLRIKGTTDKVKNNMLVRRKKDRKSRWRAGSDEEKRENALGFCSF